jgi:hypothetical protein
MADYQRYRTSREADEFSAQFDSLVARYSQEQMEDWLRGVFWGLTTNAEQYDRVLGRIREAKSSTYDEALRPCFRIFFSIEDESHILLLWIEEIADTEDILES